MPEYEWEPCFKEKYPKDKKSDQIQIHVWNSRDPNNLMYRYRIWRKYFNYKEKVFKMSEYFSPEDIPNIIEALSRARNKIKEKDEAPPDRPTLTDF